MEYLYCICFAVIPLITFSHSLLFLPLDAPWCGHCKALEPEYNKAAKMIEAGGMDFTLAKVDATVEKELAEEYKVQGYPTLKFFKNGVPREYSGKEFIIIIIVIIIIIIWVINIGGYLLKVAAVN